MLDLILANRTALIAAGAVLAVLMLALAIVTSLHGGIAHLGAMGTHHYD